MNPADGNLQLNQNKAIAATTLDGAGEGDTFGAAVVAHIKKEESAIQKALMVMYMQMNDQTFKDMRRVLPVTQRKMDWHGYGHKMAKSVGMRKGQ
jgi:capping protein (actin filament) muscle Z-line, alpha